MKSIHATAEDVEKHFDTLTILINNAGIAGDMHKTAWDFSVKELIDVSTVDFIGAFELTKKSPAAYQKNSGQIINITMPTNAMEFFHPPVSSDESERHD